MPDIREEIDFVIPWVDGMDERWRKEKEGYLPSGAEDADEVRFRDWDNLKYWFRGVEQFVPWVRKIHFVTWGHLPEWMNTEHPKLHVVNHADYIQEQFLPTFNSHTIELNLHRIEGLAEQFVYFNDDIFILDRLRQEDFFRNGRPCDMLAFQPVVANPRNPVMSHIFLNNTLVLAKYFEKRENVRQQPGNYFKVGYPPLYFFYNLLELAFPLYTGFYTVHGPAPFCKKTFGCLWEKEKELLQATCSHRFRSQEDVSPYLLREWQKLSGEFYAKNITGDFAYFNIQNRNDRLVRLISRQAKKIVCINDTEEPIDFAKAKHEINGALQQILPQKSSFER